MHCIMYFFRSSQYHVADYVFIPTQIYLPIHSTDEFILLLQSLLVAHTHTHKGGKNKTKCRCMCNDAEQQSISYESTYTYSVLCKDITVRNVHE